MIEICIGSACHLKGAYEVIQKFKKLVNDNNLDDKVELKAAFCLGECGKGVSIRVDKNEIYSILPTEVEEFFNTYVLEAKE